MTARSWTAQVLWRFGKSREMDGSRKSFAGLSNSEAKSGRQRHFYETITRPARQIPQSYLRTEPSRGARNSGSSPFSVIVSRQNPLAKVVRF